VRSGTLCPSCSGHAWSNVRTMHCLSSLEVGQRVPDLRPLANDSKDLPDAESEHGIVRSLHWFIEKNSGEVWTGSLPGVFTEPNFDG